MENTEVIQQDLLSDEIHPYFQYSQATQGQRFMNFLIDNIVMRFTITHITGYGVGYILGYLFPDFIVSVISNNNAMTMLLLAYIVGIFNYIIYYSLCEKLFRGQTPGKFFTRTKAMRNDGEELTFKDALLRSLCRLLPLEVFSGFGVPWHDSLTNTMVVKTN
jgi:uncharacterized RDD family membrane protein YckC